ncbi:MAG: hypothetical protein R2818_02665 [Flavobacteriales bacterium]
MKASQSSASPPSSRDLQRMAAEEAMALRKLREMQLPNGAWPWWSGMREGRCHPAHRFRISHLEVLKAADTRPDGPVRSAAERRSLVGCGGGERTTANLLRRSTKESLENYVPSSRCALPLCA